MSTETTKNRREFIHYSTLGVLGFALGGGYMVAPYLKTEEKHLRPPGAVEENLFLAFDLTSLSILKLKWGSIQSTGYPIRFILPY